MYEVCIVWEMGIRCVLWGHEAHPASCRVELQQLECHIPYRGGCFPALLSFQPNHTAVWMRGMAHLSGGGLLRNCPGLVTARVTDLSIGGKITPYCGTYPTIIHLF